MTQIPIYQAIPGISGFMCPIGPNSHAANLPILINFNVNGLKGLIDMQDAKQNTAKHFRTVLRDASTGAGAALTSSVLAGLTWSLCKAGASTYTTITPTITIIGGNTGLVDVALTASHLDTIGVASVHVQGGAAGMTIVPNDDLVIDVGAVDRTDAVRYGLSALPNAAAGALGGLETTALRANTAQGAGNGVNQIQLDAGASSVDGFYARTRITITGGTGAGQSRFVAAYTGSTKTASVSKNWATQPDNTSTFAITSDSNILLTEGLAQAGGATSVTLSSASSSVNNFYEGAWIAITSGTGAGQAPRLITGYVGSTKVATVDQAWATNPDNTSVYQILTGGGVVVSQYDTPNTPGGQIKPNSLADNFVYTAGKLTSSRVRVFANAAALAAATIGHPDNTDGEIERYIEAATYDGSGNQLSWSHKRVLP